MWIRAGYCCGCGSCCKGSPPNFPPPVAGYCPMFRPAGDGTGICSIHGGDNPYWKMACNPFPEHPDQLKEHPECTFTFSWAE